MLKQELKSIYGKIGCKGDDVMGFSGSEVAMVGLLFPLIPILLAALLLRWVRIIRINSEIQIEQNKEIISLLKDLAEKK